MIAPLLLVVAAAAAPVDSLNADLQVLARASGGTLGVFVQHLERHESASVNVEHRFPMASTFKLPLAVATLRAVELGQLPALDAAVELQPADMIPWASPLHDRLPDGGRVTLREILTALLEDSDNSAANALLRLDGGAPRVGQQLTALGIDGLSIDRDEAELTTDFRGVPRVAAAGRTAKTVARAADRASASQRRAGFRRFQRDPRDRATPPAMASLLERIWKNELLSPLNLGFLRGGLEHCHTGVARLRAGVPAGTVVADRTGTCGGLAPGESVCANDVGVLTLPTGEHVVIAAYFEDQGGRTDAKEAVLASVARVVWRHYTGAR